MATAKKSSAKAKAKPAAKAKKAAVKKAAAPKKEAAPKAAPKNQTVDLSSLDRRGLAARAKQLKLELLAIRFNIQAPSLIDYRKKRRELAAVLGQLR